MLAEAPVTNQFPPGTQGKPEPPSVAARLERRRLRRKRALAMLAAAPLAFAASASTPDPVAVARAYEHGEGVPKDPARAAALYCDAARDGDAEAAYALGWMYANARGVPRNDGYAAALFARAAHDGHAHAQRMLGYVGNDDSQPPDCLRPLVPATAWGPPEPEPPAPDLDPDPFEDLPRWKRQIADLVFRAAPRYGVDPRLALAVIAVESNFDTLAVSPKDARGLMQLIPETAARYNVKDPFNARQNLHGGLAYLRFLLAYYRGQVALAAAAYNAGEAAVDRHRGVPPYPETQAYVQKVRALYRSEVHPYDPREAEPSPVLGLAAEPPGSRRLPR
jgi:hypothetical protein